ncbi:unnamed protein product [Alternaria alternata]
MSSISARTTSIELTADVIDGLRNLSVVRNSSDKGIDDEENINSDLLDDLDDEDLEIVFGYRVDLITQESQHKRKPIYTRGLLNDVKLFVDQIHTAKMQEYWAAMMHTKRLWKESSSRRKLREDFEETAKRCVPITQVVCFGLGALNLNKKFYHSAIQYMAVFSIIQILNDFYRQTDPDRHAIKLVLQDPNYEIKAH